MQIIAFSQRMDFAASYGETRDALDRRWLELALRLGMAGFAVPNDPQHTVALLDVVSPSVIVLTGGNDVADFGDDVPQRDETERLLCEWARAHHLPIIGVCRGMQYVLTQAGCQLVPLQGHVRARHALTGDIARQSVNSFHNYGFQNVVVGFDVISRAMDGTVEAVRSRDGSFLGIMWHPERELPFDEADIALLSSFIRGHT